MALTAGLLGIWEIGARRPHEMVQATYFVHSVSILEAEPDLAERLIRMLACGVVPNCAEPREV